VARGRDQGGGDPSRMKAAGSVRRGETKERKGWEFEIWRREIMDIRGRIWIEQFLHDSLVKVLEQGTVEKPTKTTNARGLFRPRKSLT
jgi:hypothetical protein